MNQCPPQSVLDAVVPQTHSDPHGRCLGAVCFLQSFSIGNFPTETLLCPYKTFHTGNVWHKWGTIGIYWIWWIFGCNCGSCRPHQPSAIKHPHLHESVEHPPKWQNKLINSMCTTTHLWWTILDFHLHSMEKSCLAIIIYHQNAFRICFNLIALRIWSALCRDALQNDSMNYDDHPCRVAIHSRQGLVV